MAGNLFPATFGMIFLYSSEIFPTSVRSRGLSLSSLMARVGGVAAPFVGSLDKHLGAKIPLAIFGTVAISAGMLAYFLPETRSKKIPDTIEEGANIKCSWRLKAKKEKKATQSGVYVISTQTDK